MNARTIACVFALLLTAPSGAFGAELDPVESARAALERFAAASLQGDSEGAGAELNFPHVILDRELSVLQSRDEFAKHFDEANRGRLERGDRMPTVAVARVAGGQVHFVAEYASSVPTEVPDRGFYILNNDAGHWGIRFQCRFNGTAQDPDAARAVTETIARFFTAWNAEDNDAVHTTIRFPHAFLFSDGRVSAAGSPGELITDFAGMREREGWAKSTFDGLDFYHADASLALVYMTFHRMDARGLTYRSVPALWVFTRDSSDFGLQVRVILEEP